MSIQCPVRVQKDQGSIFPHIRDASNRVIASGLIGTDAEEIVNALNSQPKKKSKKIEVAEALRRSDLSAQICERDDIEWGHNESLPRGEHVARLSKGRTDV